MIVFLRRLALIMLAGIPLWLLLRRPWKRKPVIRELVLAAFVLFMAGLMIFTLEGDWDTPAAMLASARTRLATMDRIWLQPFNTIVKSFHSTELDAFLINIVGNIVMFMPWGFCLPILWRKFRSVPVMIAMCLGLTLFIECTQLFINRFVETDDVILNSLGGILGAAAWWCTHRIWPSTDTFLAQQRS